MSSRRISFSRHAQGGLQCLLLSSFQWLLLAFRGAEAAFSQVPFSATPRRFTDRAADVATFSPQSERSMMAEARQPQHVRAELAVLLPPWVTAARGEKLEESGTKADRKQEILSFATWPIDPREVFLLTKLSFAFVNLKPILPGHVLVSPRRVAQSFLDLTSEEVADLWLTAQRVGYVIKALHSADALTFAIQDGREAGQTVPHVHIHVMPRRKGDFSRNDELYEVLDSTDFSRASGQRNGGCSGKNTNEAEAGSKGRESSHAGLDDEDRKPRSPEEMFAEAARIIDFIRGETPVS